MTQERRRRTTNHVSNFARHSFRSLITSCKGQKKPKVAPKSDTKKQAAKGRKGLRFVPPCRPFNYAHIGPKKSASSEEESDLESDEDMDVARIVKTIGDIKERNLKRLVLEVQDKCSQYLIIRHAFPSAEDFSEFAEACWEQIVAEAAEEQVDLSGEEFITKVELCSDPSQRTISTMWLPWCVVVIQSLLITNDMMYSSPPFDMNVVGLGRKLC